jgi:outer membrane protein assembly factor BamB
MLRPLRAFVPLALASAPLAAQAPPDYTTGEDVAVAGSTALPLAGPRSDQAVRSDVQGGRLIALGGSYGFPLEVDRVATVAAVEDDGGIAWTWVNERHDEMPLGLFAPANGTGAFVSLLRDEPPYDDTLVVVRVDDGHEAWRAEVPAENLWYEPVVEFAGAEDGSRLFLVADRGNLTDLVVALNPATGAPVWSRDLATNTDPLAIATDAAGSAVYVLQTGKTLVVTDRVTAFDGATGADLWSEPLYVGDQGQPLCMAAAPDGSLVVVGFDPEPSGNDLVAIESDGSVAWITSVGGRVLHLDYDPVAADVLVVAQEDAPPPAPLALAAHAVRRQNGAVKWSAALAVPTYSGNPVTTSLDSAGQRLALYYDVSPLGVHDPNTGVLTWLDLANDGAVLFQDVQPLPAEQLLRLGGVGVLAGGARVVRWSSVTPAGQPDEDFEAVGFQGDGAVVWTAVFGIEAAAPTGLDLAAPAGGPSVFALLRDSGEMRELAAIDRTSGALAWQVELPPAEEISAVWLDPGGKVAASADGALVFTRRVGSSWPDYTGLDGVDGATGALLWSKSYQDFSNANDLVAAQPAGAGGPVLFASHGPNISGRTAMRAVDGATGATLWVQEFPAFGFLEEDWESATLAVDEAGGRVFGLVGSIFPKELRVLERDAATGALISSTALVDDDFFAPGVGLGEAVHPSDVVLSADGSVLYVLGFYFPSHLAVAALDTASWSTRWAHAVDPGLDLMSTPGRLVLSGDGATLGVVSDALFAVDDQRVVVLGLDAATGATEWQRTLGATGDPRVLLDAAPGADPRTVALALGRADGVGEALALDLATGAPLFAVTADTPSGGDRIRALASAGGATFALVDATTTVPGGAAAVARLEPDALVSGPDATSLAAPEPAVFLLDRPASSAGHLYVVAGSATGTTPGIPYGGVVVPLVADPYLLLTLNHANQPPFLGTLGLLDPAGDARATLAVPAGLDPSLAGVTLHHAFVELTAGLAAAFASEPVTLELVD